MNQIAAPFTTGAGDSDTISCARDDSRGDVRHLPLSREHDHAGDMAQVPVSYNLVLRLKIWFHKKIQEKKKVPKDVTSS